MKASFVASLLCLLLLSFTTMAQEGDPSLTEVWEPKPPVVRPGAERGAAPSDAVVLFDGTNLNEWQSANGGPAQWKVQNNVLTVEGGTGDIKTNREFGNIQLHIEWRAPEQIRGEGQGRGNSGIFFQERYELQVLDSYDNPTYSNGQAGSIYKQTMPLVNAMKQPGEWNTYDVIYMAPQFNEQGMMVKPATITAFHNGVLIQHNKEVQGTTEYIGAPRIEAHGPASIQLQDHGDPVSYRNIWLRELK